MNTDATILLTEATKAQLRQFATVTLGLEVGNFAKKPEILAKIREAHEGDTITISNEAVEQKPKNPEKSATKQPAEPEQVQEMEHDPQDPNHPANKMETIFIDTVEAPGGEEPVWVQVNGKGIWIPRGKDVEVKHKFVHVLENAVRSVYDQEVDDNGNPTGQIIERKVKAYPWRHVQKAPEQAVA